MIAGARHAFLERRHGPVLRDVCLAVDAGERLALVGANGAGKTSLLRLLAGFERPTRGAVTVAPLGSGFVPQASADGLFPWFSALENVAMPRLVARLADAREVARRCLAVVAPRLDGSRRTGRLSGGEQQLVSIARALASPGPLVLADEPFASLAPGTRDEVRRAVAAALEGRALVLVTHDLEDARALGARVLRVDDGRLVEEARP